MRMNNPSNIKRTRWRFKTEIIKYFLVGLMSALTVLLLLPPGSPAAETIRMAWFALPPHVIPSEDGKMPTGPTISLFEAIATRMGCKVEWVGPIPLNRLPIYQKTGEVKLDGAFLHIKTEAILPFLYYPRKPFFIGIPSLAVRSDNPLKEIRSFEDIKGYRIGFVKLQSVKYPPIIENNRDKVMLDELTGENWSGRNLAKLLAHRLDAVYERNQYTSAYHATVDKISDRIKIIPLPGPSIRHYYVFHKSSPRGADLLRRYERATAEWNFNYDAMVIAEIKRLENKHTEK